MLPVALLAFSGILLGVGSSLSSSAVKESIPFLDFMPLQLLFMWMTKIGLVAFIYLPIMFAVAIPLGLAREEKGVAAFAGFVGYAALNLSINFYLTVAGVLGNAEQEAAYGVKSIIGIDSIDTGILGAVIVGIIVAKLHARFYTYKMPDALAFFGGARFVPIITTGVVACVVGGITEPLEFLFLFVAPALYLIHAVLTGLGFMVMGLLDVTIGNTDGNIIDFFIFGILQGTATKWYLVPVVAGIWFAVYYSVFRFAITRFNLKTPGREVESAEQIASAVTGEKTTGYKGDIILNALGGADNIESLDNCITRLRLSVKDMALVNDAVLKANGALGVVKLDAHNLQVVIGPQVHLVKNEIQSLMPA